MKLKSLLLATVLAFSTASVLAAVTPTETAIVLQQDGLTWTADYGASHVAGEFTDIFTFTPAAIGGTADTTFFNIAYTPSFGIEFTGATLNGYALTFVTSSPLPGATFTLGGLLPTDIGGALTLTISGISQLNGSYAGTLNVLTAVPEPGTYALMLGGLGMLGFMARRRRQQR